MRKMSLLFLFLFAGSILAQEHTVNYQLSIFPVDGQSCFPATTVTTGSFMTGDSFYIPAQTLSGDLAPFQSLYDAVVGTSFKMDSGALNEDVTLIINLTQLDCSNLGFYANPLPSGPPIFFFLQVIVVVDGIPQISDYYFNDGKYAWLTIPISDAMNNFLNSVGITDLNDVAFGYWADTNGDNIADTWVNTGIEWSMDNGNYICRLEHFSKFGGGRGNLVSVEDETISLKPEKFSISQNYPNPFNPTTKIQYSIPEEGYVTLKVYNALGAEVAGLVSKYKNAGVYEATFNGAELSSGAYFYTINYNNKIQTRKMLLIK